MKKSVIAIIPESPISAVGMTYDVNSTPFDTSLFLMQPNSAASRYCATNEVPMIALVSSDIVGQRARLNGFEKNFFFLDEEKLPEELEIKGRLAVTSADYNDVRKGLDLGSPAPIRVYDIDTGYYQEFSDGRELTLKIKSKFGVYPLLAR